MVAVDYFTKWAEAKPLVEITKQKTPNFVCRFGIPQAIVTDNGKQFDNPRFRGLCQSLGIKNLFSSPAHLQANRQVVAINKIIKHHLKTKLEKHKGAWANLLPFILWFYRTMHTITTRETPYSLVFGMEVVVPVEIGMPSYRVQHFQPKQNEK